MKIDFLFLSAEIYMRPYMLMLSRFRCDRTCNLCPLKNLCTQVRTPEYSCIFFGCKLSKPALKYLRYCSQCNLSFSSWDCGYIELTKLVKMLGKIQPFPSKTIKLPRLVPIIVLGNSSSYCWDIIDTGAIIVSFRDLFFNKEIMKQVLRKGIHSFLDYNGLILLSSIMPDELLVKDNIFQEFTRVAIDGGFDGVIGWDSPVYTDIPLYYSWINLLKGLELTYRLCKLNLPVIGLAKGNTYRQIAFSINCLANMGIKTLALHVSEYLINFKLDPFARNILYNYANEIVGKFKNLIVIGAMSPSNISIIRKLFGRVKNLSLAGLSFFLDAKNFRIYLNSNKVDISNKFLKCYCPVCRNHSIKDFVENVKLRAAHNLLQLQKQLHGKMESDYEISDLIIEHGKKAVILSDIHIWTAESLLEDCLNFLESECPDYIIFLGDIFDFNNGEPSLYDLIMFFGTLNLYRVMFLF